MPVISALRMLRQKDPKFENSLNYIARPCIPTATKIINKKNRKEKIGKN
jgi:hypothetical protein